MVPFVLANLLSKNEIVNKNTLTQKVKKVNYFQEVNQEWIPYALSVRGRPYESGAKKTKATAEASITVTRAFLLCFIRSKR